MMEIDVCDNRGIGFMDGDLQKGKKHIMLTLLKHNHYGA